MSDAYLKGSARISNVQMINIGQLANESPGMGQCVNSLSFFNLGPNNGTRIQYIKNNSFVNGFDCGISIDAVSTGTILQRTSGIIIENNVLFGTNYPLVISGLSNIVRKNLVVETNSLYGCLACLGPNCTPGPCNIVIMNATIAEDNYLAGLTFIFAGDSCPYGDQFPNGITSSIKNNQVSNTFRIIIKIINIKNIFFLKGTRFTYWCKYRSNASKK